MRPAQPYSPFLPQTAQISAEILRADTRDTRRFPCGDADGPMRPAPFRRTHRRPWPQSATPVRRNLDQYPRFAGTYTFSAKEKDSETGYSYFGSRYYPSDLSIWLSVDPMAAKYPSLSSYVYCANNPVKLTDPDGKWVPGLDDDNNIIVTKEEGDDMGSFKKFMGPAYSDDEIQTMYGQMSQDGKINLTKTYGNEFQIMTDALNSARKDPLFTQNKNYNCWGASLALMRGEELYGNGPDPFLPWSRDGVGLNSSGLFDFALNYYTPVKQEAASVGKTIMRFGPPLFGKTTHASIFLGIDNSGNEYTFSKDGWNARPVVYYSRMLGYEPVMGRTPQEPGYYVKK